MLFPYDAGSPSPRVPMRSADATNCGLNCSFSDFLHLLSDYIQLVVDQNDDQVPARRRSGVHNNRLLNFQAHSEPPLSVAAYVRRIGEYGNISRQALICGLVLLERMLLVQGTFLTSRNAHRLLFVSFVIAAKLVDDLVEGNRFYAMVGGMTPPELMRLEVLFLQLSDIALEPVAPTDYDRWLRAVFSVADSPRGSPRRIPPSSEAEGESACVPTSSASPNPTSVGHDDVSPVASQVPCVRRSAEVPCELTPSQKRVRLGPPC